jgi:hypothetical protein
VSGEGTVAASAVEASSPRIRMGQVRSRLIRCMTLGVACFAVQVNTGQHREQLPEGDGAQVCVANRPGAKRELAGRRVSPLWA